MGSWRSSPPVPIPRQVEQWLREREDVRRLLASWGIDLARADASAARLASLESNVMADVPDPTALAEAITQALAALEAASEPWEHAGLLREVSRLRQDAAGVLRRLNQDPVQEQLPFIETIPIRRGKVTSWRTPLDQTMVRKRPRDAARFRDDLSALTALFEDAAVRQAADQLRRAVDRENGYVVTPLRLLRQRIEAARPAASDAALDRLRGLLTQVLSAAARGTRDGWMAVAQAYLDSGWNLPSVQQTILPALLRRPCAEFEWSLAGWRARRQVALLRSEVERGVWNPRELRLRLRHWMDHGAYLPTITFTLLAPRDPEAKPGRLAIVRPLPARRPRKSAS